MGLLEDLAFETERRSILFHKDTTMPDNTQLGYDGDPNSANPVNSDGEFLLHYSPAGTNYCQKNTIPFSLWTKKSDNPGGIWEVAGAGSAPTTPELLFIYNSDGTLAVEDLVYQSPSENRYVLKVIDNTTVNPVIGMVQSLQMNDTVVVMQVGIFTITDTLSSGKTVFVGTNGRPTTTPPSTGFLQSLGVATTTNELFINPEVRRVQRA
jgi:hypothetical protein